MTEGAEQPKWRMTNIYICKIFLGGLKSKSAMEKASRKSDRARYLKKNRADLSEPVEWRDKDLMYISYSLCIKISQLHFFNTGISMVSFLI